MLEALKTSSPRDFGGSSPFIVDHVYPVDSVNIHEGSRLTMDGAGNVRPLLGGERFAGIAVADAENVNGQPGDVSVKVRVWATEKVAVEGASAASVGKTVVARNDNHLDIDVGTGGYGTFGTITNYYPRKDCCLVVFAGFQLRMPGEDVPQFVAAP